MDRYRFEKVFSRMAQEYGKISDEQASDNPYVMVLFALEGNALKIHRENPKSNSRRMREAIALALFDIMGRTTGETYDVDNFRDQDNAKLEWALLMAFDPFTNEKIGEMIGTGKRKDELHEYYRVPAQCLLKIKDSVDLWEKQRGSDGYFTFIEEYMGSGIQGKEMEFAVVGKGKKRGFFQRFKNLIQ